MELYLIRHAQSENNARPPSRRVDDPPLTRIGHEQARRLSRRVAQLNPTHLITSPFLRTLQTTDYLRQCTGLVPEVRVALHEKGGCVAGTGLGSMTGRPGLTREQIGRQYADFAIEPEIDGQGWWGGKPLETIEEATERAKKLLDDTLLEFGDTDQRVALVMHGDFLLLLLSHIHPRRLNLAWNASLSRVRVAEAIPTLELYACARHLPNYLVTW